MGGRDSKIVSEGEATSVINTTQVLEQHVKADSEDKRGGGAALLDPSANEDAVRGFSGENRLDLHIVQEAADCITDPFGHVYFFKNSVDEGMGDRVESASCIQEKQVVLLASGEFGVILLGEGVDVVSADSMGNEPFLVRMESGVERGGDRFRHGFRYNAISSVSD